jgi:hypothetical protein
MQNPAANVADNGSDIRISRLRTHLVGSKVYVQLETNRKVVGWASSCSTPIAPSRRRR